MFQLQLKLFQLQFLSPISWSCSVQHTYTRESTVRAWGALLVGVRRKSFPELQKLRHRGSQGWGNAITFQQHDTAKLCSSFDWVRKQAHLHLRSPSSYQRLSHLLCWDITREVMVNTPWWEMPWATGVTNKYPPSPIPPSLLPPVTHPAWSCNFTLPLPQS